MKILITGGTGFIGSHLANYLSVNNDVTVCDNKRANVIYQKRLAKNKTHKF